MNIKNIKLILGVAFAAVLGFTSCKDQPDAYETASGVPTIHYIRPADAAQKDSLLVQAYTATPICIVGENLRSIKEMYFNDVKAVLNTSYMTDNTILLTIPKEVPTNNTGKIYMVTCDQDTVSYDFKVLVSPPYVAAMTNEWVKVGEEAEITGLYFVNDPVQPLSITFTGINNSINVPVPQEDIKVVSQSCVRFKVPEGAEQGQINVTSIYGTGKSKFYFQDKRGIITDFDGPEVNNHRSSSVNGIIPQGWNLAPKYSTEDGVDGYYAQVGPVDTEGGWTEALKLSFWCGNWGGDPMSIKNGPGTPVRNVIDMTNWEKMSFKMEVCILPDENKWSAGALQILFANNKQCANDTWQNNTYIQTKADGGLDLPRALWAPWKDSGSFDTQGKWITLTIPLTDFIYNMDGSKVSTPMSVDSFDSFVIWPINGGITGTPCTPIFRYDNIRIVPNL